MGVGYLSLSLTTTWQMRDMASYSFSCPQGKLTYFSPLHEQGQLYSAAQVECRTLSHECFNP